LPRLPELPELEWNDAGAPRARWFDDVYFSARGGLAESEAVFLAGCGLPEAWASRERFAVCELGFGAGLNALALWRAWKNARNPRAILHMCSIEALPMARADAARALGAFPELSDMAERLLAAWPVRARAPQRLWFAEDGFALTLIIDDVASALNGLQGRFDAFFLDGFAPARNPEMWSPEVFARLGELAAPGARAASYSVAGMVRRGLEAAEFAVEKKPGFGGKRERLEARFRGSVANGGGARPGRVAIIGAGVAGAASAHALARRGCEAVVLDAGADLGAGASGNPAGLIAPRLDRDDGPLREVFLAAYLAAVAAYEQIGPAAYLACGVAQRPDARIPDVLADILADPPLPPDWLAPFEGGSALHARAGLVRPRAALEYWMRGAEVRFGVEAKGLTRSGAGWRVLGADGRVLIEADAVVLACGAGLARFDSEGALPIELTRGQLEWGPAHALPARAVSGGSFAAALDAGVVFGATFDPAEGEAAPAADAASRARNISALATLAPEIAAGVDDSALRSRAALRASTPDRAPIVGLMPDAPEWRAQGADINHGRSFNAAMLDGLGVVGALGARGFLLAPLMGEVMAAELCGEPQVLSRRALEAISPARFLRRTLKRGG
jgi:tRNA 5-methylaminomethyl-2-thiouridine biosynthesis bifunctional protein